MTAVTLSAPSKINLYLHVMGKREDGYHLLDSLVVFADDAADIVSVEESDSFSFSVSGPFASGIESDNLVTRAARMFFGNTGIAENCKIHLEKNIPIGAGLGGGSADAAATLHALEDLFQKKFTGDPLKLGADVPVCYESAPCRFQGIGERITPVPALPPLPMVLIWPGAPVATKDVFAARENTYRSEITLPESFGSLSDFVQFLSRTGNDLSKAAEHILPEILTARAFLEQNGCLLARMSGSGSCVFGIFENRAQCMDVQKRCEKSYPAWWTRAVTA